MNLLFLLIPLALTIVMALALFFMAFATLSQAFDFMHKD